MAPDSDSKGLCKGSYYPLLASASFSGHLDGIYLTFSHSETLGIFADSIGILLSRTVGNEGKQGISRVYSVSLLRFLAEL